MSKSLRTPGYDYAENGKYCITILTKDLVHYFGEIVNGEMIKNTIGELAEAHWYDMFKNFPFTRQCEFAVMPNHIHGIIEVQKPIPSIPSFAVLQQRDNPEMLKDELDRDAINRVPIKLIPEKNFILDKDLLFNELPPREPVTEDGIHFFDPLNTPNTQATANIGGVTHLHNPMFYESISRMIRYYKGRFSFEVKKINTTFKWHPKFFDIIITNEKQYAQLAHAVLNNEKFWDIDKYNVNNKI